MISGVYSASPSLVISSPALPYINNTPNSGTVRWNTQSNFMEVYNGSSWQQVGGMVNVSLSGEVESIIKWAREEMQKSMQIKAAAARSVTVADALAAYEDAASKLQVIMTLADKDLA